MFSRTLKTHWSDIYETYRGDYSWHFRVVWLELWKRLSPYTIHNLRQFAQIEWQNDYKLAVQYQQILINSVRTS